MIRVLRLIEYTFDSFEEADKHLSQCSVPANGSKDFGRGMMRSIILVTPFSVALDAEPEEEEHLPEAQYCSSCGRDKNGYAGPLCRYCAGTGV